MSRVEPVPTLDEMDAVPIIVSAELTDPHPITRRTAAAHGWKIGTPWDAPRPEYRDCFCVWVSDRYRDRALRLIDALLKGCNARGFELRHDPAKTKHLGLSVYVGEEPVPVELRERGNLVPRLSVEIGDVYGWKMKAIKDHPRRPLETRLHLVLSRIRATANERIAWRRTREESERRQQEFKRQRAELCLAVREEQRAVDELIAEARDWQEAMTIRAFVAAVTAQVARDGTTADHADWIKWASDQADRLDPLCESPPSVLDTPQDAYREPGWEEYIDDEGNCGPACKRDPVSGVIGV